MYARKCSREEFATLRYVLVGAEKLREPIAAAFREKFGLELMEGYGCTEMSPVVAVNAPDFADDRESQTGTKPGTVGHPLPGVAAKIVHPETYEPIPAQRRRAAVSERPKPHGGISESTGAYRRSQPTKLVRHRRYRHHRRRRLSAHYGPPFTIQQNRRRDGSPLEGGGSDRGSTLATRPAASPPSPIRNAANALSRYTFTPNSSLPNCGGISPKVNCQSCGFRNAKTSCGWKRFRRWERAKSIYAR